MTLEQLVIFGILFIYTIGTIWFSSLRGSERRFWSM
jgi:biotin transporter BioY